jgi:hypothetical protein
MGEVEGAVPSGVEPLPTKEAEALSASSARVESDT